MADEDPNIPEQGDNPVVPFDVRNGKENMKYIDENKLDELIEILSGFPKQDQARAMRVLYMYQFLSKSPREGQERIKKIKEVTKKLGITEKDIPPIPQSDNDPEQGGRKKSRRKTRRGGKKRASRRVKY